MEPREALRWPREPLSPTQCPWQAGGIQPKERKWEKGRSRTQREKEAGGERGEKKGRAKINND